MVTENLDVAWRKQKVIEECRTSFLVETQREAHLKMNSFWLKASGSKFFYVQMDEQHETLKWKSKDMQAFFVNPNGSSSKGEIKSMSFKHYYPRVGEQNAHQF